MNAATTSQGPTESAKEKVARAFLGPIGFSHAQPVTIEEAYALVSLGYGDSITFGDSEVLLTSEWIWRES